MIITKVRSIRARELVDGDKLFVIVYPDQSINVATTEVQVLNILKTCDPETFPTVHEITINL